MGTLMYGAGHVWAGRAHFYLRDYELSRSPPDESFIDMLKQNCCLTGPHFPPPAIVEVLQDYVTNYHKVRRLHLIVVDLWRPCKYNTARAREITDQLWLIRDCDDTRRVSPFRPDGPEPPLRCRRFAYGYALDGFEFLCYLVWPQRDGQSYVLLDTATADTLVLDQSFFRPLGMQYLRFAPVGMLWHSLAWMMMSSYLICTLPEQGWCVQDLALTRNIGSIKMHRRQTGKKSLLRLCRWPPMRWIPIQTRVATSGSEGSESASDSEQNDPPSSLASDAEQYERMQASYVTVGRDFKDQEDLIGSEYRKLQRLELVPERWPLAMTVFWLGVAGRSMQHGRIPKNRCLPFAKCRNAWPWCLLFIWPKRWLPSFGLFWHILPKSSMMTGRRICYAPTTGCTPSFRNCCIHRPVTMPQGLVKGIDPAVAWPVSLHTLGHPRNWNHLLLAPDLLTGLVLFAMRIACRSGFLPSDTSPVARHGGCLPSCPPILDGPGCGSGRY